MIKIGKRIIFDSTTGRIVVEFSEMEGNMPDREAINKLDFIDLEFGYEADKFALAKSYHIDPTTKEVVFDELYEITLTPEQQIEQLQNELMIAQGVI